MGQFYTQCLLVPVGVMECFHRQAMACDRTRRWAFHMVGSASRGHILRLSGRRPELVWPDRPMPIRGSYEKRRGIRRRKACREVSSVHAKALRASSTS